MTNRSSRWLDAVVAVGLIAASLTYLRFFDWSRPPNEDAAMLMRYAEHLAAGQGIVWNIGEPPVDGATDFLSMVMIAGVILLGFETEHAVRILTFGTHFLTVLLVYFANRWLWRSGRFAAAFSALYLAAGLGLAYVNAYFCTPIFALSATVTWMLCLRLTNDEQAPTKSLSFAFAISALVTGLIRPEGVILSGLMVVGLLVSRGWRRARPTIVAFSGVFGILGGTYFAWRWWYFGHPLPNPYYLKGASRLHWDSLQLSLIGLFEFIRPFVPAFLLSLWSAASTRRMIVTTIPIVGFASAFILIGDEMNYSRRFQYALLPMTLISWVPLVQGLRLWPERDALRVRLAWTVTAGAVAFACIRYAVQLHCVLQAVSGACGPVPPSSGLYAAARVLSEYRDRGYTMAVTEAGLLPFYSGWRAIDTWGLNDSWIAHHGGITEEYLDRFRPEVIVSHTYFSPVVRPGTSAPLRPETTWLIRPWDEMTLRLHNYAKKRGYVVAAVFGPDPRDTFHYYVRSDFPDSRRIVEQISSLVYAIGMRPSTENYMRGVTDYP